MHSTWLQSTHLRGEHVVSLGSNYCIRPELVQIIELLFHTGSNHGHDDIHLPHLHANITEAISGKVSPMLYHGTISQ